MHAMSPTMVEDGKSFVGSGRASAQPTSRHFMGMLRPLIAGLSLGVMGPMPSAAESLRAEIMPQLGHSYEISSAVISPDGRTMLTGSDDRTARLWDIATGRELRQFLGHTGSVHSVAFSPDGRAVLTGGNDNTARLWDVATGRELRQFLGHTEAVYSVAFSPDGRTVLTGSVDKTARLWDVATARELRQFLGHTNYLLSATFSPDGRNVLTGSGDKTARLWDAATGRELRQFKGHLDEVVSVAFAADGRTLLTGSHDKTARLWDAVTGRELRQFVGHTAQLSSVSFSPVGRTVLTGGWDNTARLWDAATGRELRQFKGHAGWVRTVAFSPEGRTVLTGSADKTARLWDVATGRELRQFLGHTGSVYSVAFSPDGQTLLTGGMDKNARLWDSATGRELRQFLGHTGSVYSVAFSPDRRTVLTASTDMTARVWDSATGRELRQLTGHTSSVNSAAFSPDGRTVLTGSSDNTARLWDAETGRELRQFVHTSVVSSIAFAPDGRTVLTGSQDNIARQWDVATGRELRQFIGHAAGVNSVAFSPDGRTVLTGSWDNTARLWDAEAGRELHQFIGHTGFVYSVAFSPDGRTVLTGSTDTTVRLWEAATGRELRQFLGHINTVASVAFAPDGRTVLTGCWDGTARRWSVTAAQLLATIVDLEDKDWLTITPEGYFDASSPKAAQNLNIVRALQVSSIDQVYDVLYRPDLVREKLAGDPNGKVKAAAAQLDLDRVMASGAPPSVAITSPSEGSATASDLVEVEARVTDQGGGIGKVEWRINGVTLGTGGRGFERLTGAAAATAKKTLSLAPGRNRIEVLAYNTAGLIASEAASVTVTWDGEKGAVPPRLYVLAVGVNDYFDSRLRLSFAVPDATAIAEGFRKAGNGLYAGIDVTKVLDSDVTIANLDKVFTELGEKAQPRDVFVFFLAGHGKTKNGRYYFLPRDFRYEDENSIEKAGMDQDKFQAWFAKIPARKSILLYDTCESGSLTGANARGSDIDERLGALNRMTRATGRTFLTATTDDAPALEGYRGHGVFTYAILDALDHADVNKNGLIEVSELADYIDQKVPDISFEAFKLRQIPQRSIVGNNFVLTNKTAILPGVDTASSSNSKSMLPTIGSISSRVAVPTKPTHIVVTSSPLEVFEAIATDGTKGAPLHKLTMGTPVVVMQTVDGWDLIASDGNALGYVTHAGLAPIQ